MITLNELVTNQQNRNGLTEVIFSKKFHLIDLPYV